MPRFESSVATALQTSAFRLAMYTLHPASTKPDAIILPIPREPPVTKATFPCIENSSLAALRGDSVAEVLEVELTASSLQSTPVEASEPLREPEPEAELVAKAKAKAKFQGRTHNHDRARRIWHVSSAACDLRPS